MLEHNTLTKSEILKVSSRIYDPLRILSPVTLRAKSLIQQLWKENLTWDKTVPEKFRNVWIN